MNNFFTLDCDSRSLLSLFTSDYYSPVDLRSSHATPYSIILIVILIFESLLFAIFTIIMFAVQVQGIYNDETGIEQLIKKNNHRSAKNRSFVKRFKMILSGFNIHWLNPFIGPGVNATNGLDIKIYAHYV